ncbi:MAG: RidA family protein [Pseudomonadota bacterium]
MAERVNLDPDGLWPSRGFPMHQGVVEPSGRRVHVTGQVAWDEDGRVLHRGDAEAQTHVALDHIARILGAAGGTLDDVVSLTVYLVRRDDWPAISRARAARLNAATGPASTAVMVSGLADADLLVEVQAVAVIPDERVTAS